MAQSATEDFVLDEPTRGVDVGAKMEINGLIRALARGGTSILLITSEVEEMVSLSDRVLVLRGGESPEPWKARISTMQRSCAWRWARSA